MNPNFNPDKQHTLKGAATISGTGLHTGIVADLTLKPASPGFGLQFKRIDLPAQPTIKADCDFVTDTSREQHWNPMAEELVLLSMCCSIGGHGRRQLPD
jgi:UDP-3-O-acyl-N-acetylglucosamine deacetylase